MRKQLEYLACRRGCGEKGGKKTREGGFFFEAVQKEKRKRLSVKL